MKKRRNLIRSTLGAIISVSLACLIWEAFARSGLFAPALAPSIVLIGSALGRMVLSGAMLWHTFYTLYRVLFGFVLASIVGVFIGILMGRFRRVERFFVPLVSVLMFLAGIQAEFGLDPRLRHSGVTFLWVVFV